MAVRAPGRTQPHRLSVRTRPFQGRETGSIPVGATRRAGDEPAFLLDGIDGIDGTDGTGTAPGDSGRASSRALTKRRTWPFTSSVGRRFGRFDAGSVGVLRAKFHIHLRGTVKSAWTRPEHDGWLGLRRLRRSRYN